ncbi:MAG: putative deoxyribonuclease RhsC [Candidatus Anoxychlamydiales bacterium]|nr:putative deoxyribonuclease RhsC [Candidatus Anoxychlamydiales bacterium]
MFKKAIFLLFFFISFIFSEEKTDPFATAAISSGNASIVGGCINAITGDFVFYSNDLLSEGIEPLSINHIYSSRFRKLNFPGGILLSEHLYIICYFNRSFIVTEPSGIQLLYKQPVTNLKGIQNFKKNLESNIVLELDPESLKGLTNDSSHSGAGRLNIKNNKVTFNQSLAQIKIECADGSLRFYNACKESPNDVLEKKYKEKRNDDYYREYLYKASSSVFSYKLEKEKLSNGNWIFYEYNDQEFPVKIKSTNPSVSKIYNTIDINVTDVITCTSACKKNLKLYGEVKRKEVDQTDRWDRKHKKYKSKSKDRMCGFIYESKTSPENIDEIYKYLEEDGKVIKDCVFPDKRSIHLEYYTIGQHIVNNTEINVIDTNDPIYMRVKSIAVNFSKNDLSKEIYHFIYHPGTINEKGGFTEVYDSYKSKTIYRYSKDLRLEIIEKYNKNKIVNFERFSWGIENSDESTFLKGHTIVDSNKNATYSKHFTHDLLGNIIKEEIFGNISGLCNAKLELINGVPQKNGIESYVKERVFSKDGKNLLLEEKESNGLIITYSYLENSDKITSKLVSFFNPNPIKQRYFYQYDEDNNLIEEIKDNGTSKNKDDFSNVTRRIKRVIYPRQNYPYGLTEKIEEYYLDENKYEKLFKKEEYKYSDKQKLIEKKIFGSDGEFKYSLNYSYDEKGNLVFENDPINREAFYKYDKNNNKIYEKKSSGKEIFYEYDLANRLIQKSIKNKNQKYVQNFEYDLKNNKIKESDIFGNITEYKYDLMGNLIEEKHLEIQDAFGNIAFPKTTFAYDDLNRQIEKKDALNNITKTRFNALGKPISYTYPDNTSERYIYNLDGTLQKHINSEGTITKYDYDCLKNVISTQIFSKNKEKIRRESYEYDGFDLIAKKDPDGNITNYVYDGSGKKIEENIILKDGNLVFKERCFYDSLGQLNKIVKGEALEIFDKNDINDVTSEEKNQYPILVTIFEKDFIGRVLEERKENISGNVLSKVSYQYDDEDNKRAIISYIANNESVDKKYYDILNRPIKSIDACGNETTIHYDDFSSIKDNSNIDLKARRVITTNALGQKTISTYDSQGKEIITEIISPNGHVLSVEEKLYDLSGNLTRQKSTIYSPDRATKETAILWQYDSMNRLVSLTEGYGSSNSKTTKYTYTKKSKLKSTIKPDGTIITNEYDCFGNKIKISSSKNDIDYEFIYNNLDQLELINDLVNNFSIKRKYDRFGNLLEENFLDKWSIKNKYDLLFNRTRTVFFDGSFVKYIYDPLNISKIIRYDSSGNYLYDHKYLKYDLSSNLLKESLILSGGNINYKSDLLGQTISINTPYHTQDIEYDKIGRVFKINQFGFLDSSSDYIYDDLNQIKSEKGIFSNNYEFDSHSNRLKKNEDVYHINDLNELCSINENKFEYDSNGNLTLRKTNNDEIKYYYDSLDRLIKIEKPNLTSEYAYDAFNRRIYKKIIKESTFSTQKEIWYFLYDDQNEIGLLDKDYNIKEFRVLSDGDTAEIKNAISFEINGFIYAPIYDIAGNVASLIYKGSITEHYKYSVFGEQKIYSSWGYEKPSSQINNPWQFSSKRIDEESNLIYYGRRYYDPSLGRWLTCDPLGFEDGMNTYAFVHNNSLTNIDLYGLYANPWMFPKSSYNNDQAFNGVLSGTYKYLLNSATSFAGSNDDFIHWDVFKEQRIHQQRENSREYINKTAIDWFQNKLGADVNNSAFRNFERGTDIALTLGTVLYSIRNVPSMIKKSNTYNKFMQASRELISPSKAINYCDICPTNKLYSGLNVENIVENVKNNISKNIVKPLERGSTGRIRAKSWKERKAMMEVMKNYKDGKVLPIEMTDKRWPSKNGWEKIAQNIDGVEIHFVRNRFTGLVDDFKFKN